jgi:hypothetical protein
MAQRKTPLFSVTPITFNFNPISCYGGSYFATITVILYLSKTSEIYWAINAREFPTLLIGVITSFQSMFTIRIVLFHYQTTPKGAPVIYVNIPLQLPSSTF